MSVKCTIPPKALESDAVLFPVTFLFSLVRLEMQGIKAASQVEVCSVSGHFWLFEQLKCMGAQITESLVSHLLIPVRRLKQTCEYQLALP